MSNADSSDDKQRPPSSSSPKGKKGKSKSKGFIESTGYKPNWLETGPLPPDVLPPQSEPADEASVMDEFAALQETLERLYGRADEDAAAGAPAPETDETPSPLEAAPPVVPVEDVAAADDTVVAAAPPQATPPAEPDVPDWLRELLAEDGVPAGQEAPAAPTAEPPPARAPEPEVAFDEVAPVAFDSEPDEVVELAVPAEVVEIAAPDEAAEVAVPIAAEPPESAAPVAAVAAPAEPKPRRKRRAERQPRPAKPAQRTLRRPSRLSTAMLVVSLLLLAAAAVVYYFNPFVRLALATASLARPVATPGVVAPNADDSGSWCVQGDFTTEESLRLSDDGRQGDVLADDAVFSLEHVVAEPGSYVWQVVDCANPERVFPAASAWITTDGPDQPVTFLFDSSERADRLFFPISYTVSAIDSAADYHVVGSFQEWIADDASGRLVPLGSGLYQQVRRIARSGNYQSYVIVDDAAQAIDAYGRTTDPIPFAFDTDRNGDYVVFLIDVDRGRASVMYDMSPLMTGLAFGPGPRRLTLALAGLAGLTLLALLLREMILRNRRLWMEEGCPRCREQELMRISRQPKDRFLHVLGIPAYRYRCRNCTWEGTRLSEAGRSVSPGARITRVDSVR